LYGLEQDSNSGLIILKIISFSILLSAAVIMRNVYIK
jgi:hypothetical protein